MVAGDRYPILFYRLSQEDNLITLFCIFGDPSKLIKNASSGKIINCHAGGAYSIYPFQNL
jgi:hypothetical protein